MKQFQILLAPLPFLINCAPIYWKNLFIFSSHPSNNILHLLFVSFRITFKISLSRSIFFFCFKFRKHEDTTNVSFRFRKKKRLDRFTFAIKKKEKKENRLEAYNLFIFLSFSFFFHDSSFHRYKGTSSVKI